MTELVRVCRSILEQAKKGQVNDVDVLYVLGKLWPGSFSIMSYENISVADLFRAMNVQGYLGNEDAAGARERAAFAWVEAENIFEVRAIYNKWFYMLKAGTANDQYPDPTADYYTPDGIEITQERADAFIEAIEDDMLKERARFGHLGYNEGPGFTRLEGTTRIAFMLDCWTVMKPVTQLKREAWVRVNEKRETIPPLDWFARSSRRVS